MTDKEGYKEAIYIVPSEIVGALLLKVIHILGYRLMTKWSTSLSQRMWYLTNITKEK